MSQYDADVEFAGGLIGSDVELPAFDPLKVSKMRFHRSCFYNPGLPLMTMLVLRTVFCL
jgi:hypothetical protein